MIKIALYLQQVYEYELKNNSVGRCVEIWAPVGIFA